jgi:hypothetical protein
MHNDHEYIQILAYLLWEARGRPEGSADEDWLEAERQLAAADTQTANPRNMKLRASATARTAAPARARPTPRSAASSMDGAHAGSMDGAHAGKKQEPGWSGTS